MHSLRTAAERRDERLSCRIFRQFRHDEAVWRVKKYDAMSVEHYLLRTKIDMRTVHQGKKRTDKERSY